MLIVVRGIHGFWSVATGPNLQGGALDISTHITFLLALVLGIERTVEASWFVFVRIVSKCIFAHSCAALQK